MPLKRGYSHETFERNYQQMRREGHAHEQALAVSYNAARASYFKRYPQGVLPYWLRYANGDRRNPALRKKNPSKKSYVIEIAEWVSINGLDKSVFDAMVRTFQSSPSSWDGGDMYDLYAASVYPPERRPNPVPESSRSARRSKDARVKLAVDQYERFTGHEASELVSVDKPVMPDVMSVIGEIDGVMYTTVRDGETEKYIHEFKKNCRPLFCVSPDGKQIFMIGGSYDFTERGIVDRTR